MAIGVFTVYFLFFKKETLHFFLLKSFIFYQLSFFKLKNLIPFLIFIYKYFQFYKFFYRDFEKNEILFFSFFQIIYHQDTL